MLTYSEVRPQFKSGDIIALTHTEWDSWDDIQIQAIRLFTLSEYVHVGVVWVNGDGRVWLIEAVTPTVRVIPLSDLRDSGFYWIQTNTPMTSQEIEYGLAQVGEEYSKTQAVAGYFNTLDIGEDDSWQCAELVLAMRKRSGLNLGSKATPSAVVKAAQELGCPTYYVRNE